ncbi:MAG: zinc ABC transporter substrate-binding protein [Clostridia bacterium]|nr:zinc ABC transporter substrate-binding protein [Clostridia bacterium]
MKRILLLTLALLLLLCPAGCAAAGEQDPRPQVVATVFPQYDLVRAIAGDTVNLTLLLPPGGESHNYEPTPKNMAAVTACDLFIEIGGPSEQWAANLRRAAAGDADAPRVLTLMELEGITLLNTAESHADHNHGHDHDHTQEIDEHIWLSPANAAVMAKAVCRELCALLPENSDLYRANTDAYLAELEALDARLTEITAQAARRTLIFGDRFPFRYLTHAYGLTAYAAYPGCAAEGEPAPATVAALIERIKAEQIPAVFTIEFSRGEVADAIAAETGAVRLELHSCHNLSPADFAAGVTFLELMHRNADALEKALN